MPGRRDFAASYAAFTTSTMPSTPGQLMSQRLSSMPTFRNSGWKRSTIHST
jgi:hypothetical protein